MYPDGCCFLEQVTETHLHTSYWQEEIGPTASCIVAVQQLANEADLLMNRGDVQGEVQLCPVV